MSDNERLGDVVLARVRSAAVLGIDAYLVDVETDISNGLPSFTTVGLPQGAVKEGRERVGASIANSDFLFPSRRRSGRVWKEATPLTLRYTLIMYDTCRTLVL